MICIPIWMAILLLAGVASFSACIGLFCAALLSASSETLPRRKDANAERWRQKEGKEGKEGKEDDHHN